MLQLQIKQRIKSIAKELIPRKLILLTKNTFFDVSLATFFARIKPIETNYGLVRIGGQHDGGYLIPDDLDGIKYCFSPGTSTSADFEYELAQTRGIKSFLADYSVTYPPIQCDLFSFEKRFLGISDNEKYMTLDSWIVQNIKDDKSELILQMDIEGDEYDVIWDVSENTLLRFRILVIEFHGLKRLLSPFTFTKLQRSFKKLTKYFYVVHIHPNNYGDVVSYKGYEVPNLLEFTFLRKDRVLSRKRATTFPHALDKDNIPSYDPLYLPDCWYS